MDLTVIDRFSFHDILFLFLETTKLESSLHFMPPSSCSCAVSFLCLTLLKVEVDVRLCKHFNVIGGGDKS